MNQPFYSLNRDDWDEYGLKFLFPHQIKTLCHDWTPPCPWQGTICFLIGVNTHFQNTWHLYLQFNFSMASNAPATKAWALWWNISEMIDLSALYVLPVGELQFPLKCAHFMQVINWKTTGSKNMCHTEPTVSTHWSALFQEEGGCSGKQSTKTISWDANLQTIGSHDTWLATSDAEYLVIVS